MSSSESFRIDYVRDCEADGSPVDRYLLRIPDGDPFIWVPFDTASFNAAEDYWELWEAGTLTAMVRPDVIPEGLLPKLRAMADGTFRWSHDTWTDEGGSGCPDCGGQDIAEGYDSMSMDEKGVIHISMTCKCRDCGAMWSYSLPSIGRFTETREP